MDNFVEELRQETRWLSTEETEDESATNALVPGIYLPLLPKHFNHPNMAVKSSEFQKMKEDCLCCIQDALLQSQWQRAAELMISYLEMLETTSSQKRMMAQEEIWRIGTEILQHHPQSNIEEINYFADRMKNLGVKRYLKISLEHAFHLLCSGFLDEAYQNLILIESWRYGEETVAQEKELKLIQAYKGLMGYYTWLKKKTDLLELEKRKKHKLQLKVIFAVLDFAGWKENVKAWSYLAKQTVEILQNSDKQFHWLKKEWDSRKDWWPAFHFSLYLAKSNWQENKKLTCEKVLIAGILLGKDCKYFKHVTKEGCKIQKKKFRQLKKFVKEHSWVSLRLADT